MIYYVTDIPIFVRGLGGGLFYDANCAWGFG